MKFCNIMKNTSYEKINLNMTPDQYTETNHCPLNL